ncbi:hypothetical protein NC652_009532 [Populus alba x Populus x berolinensis]|nr:hypothetical protein NC652_009532 [Populus alba x Populus x berolinensis]
MYLHIFPIQQLFFFESPISDDHFHQYVIPTLKALHFLSLSNTSSLGWKLGISFQFQQA